MLDYISLSLGTVLLSGAHRAKRPEVAANDTQQPERRRERRVDELVERLETADCSVVSEIMATPS